MDKGLYTAMTGAEQTMFAQSIHANNLANINTVGFRADLEHFSSQNVNGNGLQTRVFAESQATHTNFAPGALVTTNRELDFAIEDDGFFAVQASTGEEAYTRAGDLMLTAEGLLTTSKGLPVIGNGGPIVIPPAEKIEIGQDGTISIRPVGQSSESLAVLDRIKLVNPAIEELEKGTDGLIHLKSKDIAEADANVSIVSGTLEMSNVNAIEEMTQIISLARTYEMQVKLMKNLEENEATLDSLMQLQG